MRRWNGWGDTSVTYPLPESAVSYLQEKVPPGDRSPDADIEHVLRTIPPSQLRDHPLIEKDPLSRLLHARGQSLPDWIALRSGVIEAFPDGVAVPERPDHVPELLAFAESSLASIIPYGGGTSVVGHINPLPGGPPALTIDMRRFNRLLSFDEESRLATFGAGATGPTIEEQLGRLGYRLGHFPQSWEYSTLGGWIATRSSGQQSYGYGRIEDLFAGGQVETPRGQFELPPLPASAAGPDLRQVVLGSEGRLGVITRAVLRVRPLPVQEFFWGVFFHAWEDGRHAARALVQSRVPLSMVRLSDAQETETTLALVGRERLLKLADGALSLLGYREGRCLMILGISAEGGVDATKIRQQALDVIRSCGGLNAGTLIGKEWAHSRFKSPYLRNTLWQMGYALDTLESAVSWNAFEQARVNALAGIRNVLEVEGVGGLAFSHLSHLYADGAGFYITYIFPRSEDPHETLSTWRAAKRSASNAILDGGGTISHQHGVGLDHRDDLPGEKGPLGVQLIRAFAQAVDPAGILNPGKLIAADPSDTQI
jgi:alkyldihydroxyacetonephosphate synthase